MGSARSRALAATHLREREEMTRDVMEKLLVCAICEHDTVGLAKLVRYIDVNSTLRSGESILTHAVKEGSEESVALLIKLGADCNKSDNNGQTPLHVAVFDGNEKMLTTLLTYAADPNQFDTSGLNCLQLASQLGRRAMLPRLLAVGARSNVTCQTGEKATPVILSAANGHSDCIEILATAGSMIDFPDAWGNSALLKAISAGHLESVKTLLKHGANVNARNRSGTSALQNAVLNGNHDIIHLLIECKCSLDKFSLDLPPLHAATLNGCQVCLLLLLAAGTNIECIDSNRKTALYMAVTDLPNIEHYYRYFPLKKNAYRLKCARTLIENGANISKVWKTKFWNTRFRSSEQMALYRLCVRAYGFLRVSPCAMKEIFNKALLSGCMDTVKLLVCAGYPVTEADMNTFLASDENACRCTCLKLEDEENGTCLVPRYEMKAWLNDIKVHPHRLKDVCRLKLRSLLTNNVIAQVRHLPISDCLKSYLIIASTNV